jgi:hypothetical protein
MIIYRRHAQGLHADIGSLKRFRINRGDLAKKVSFLGGPVGPSSDITSKRGFFANLFECNGELKRFLQHTTQRDSGINMVGNCIRR